jgi:hypothetical protein
MELTKWSARLGLTGPEVARTVECPAGILGRSTEESEAIPMLGGRCGLEVCTR